MIKTTTTPCVPSVRGRSVFAVPRAEVTLALWRLAVGVATIALGIPDDATGQTRAGIANPYYSVVNEGMPPVSAVDAALMYIEGEFGALLMACAGIGAILSAALAKSRAEKRLYLVALGLFAFGLGVFILRAAIGVYCNDIGIQE
jgi:hypothetical protein